MNARGLYLGLWRCYTREGGKKDVEIKHLYGQRITAMGAKRSFKSRTSVRLMIVDGEECSPRSQPTKPKYSGSV